MSERVDIIGGGGSGLACAWYLAKKRPDLKIHVWEKDQFPGGLAGSFETEEFKVEKIDDDITIQYLKPTYFTAFLADLIYKMNNLIVDEFGNVVYDASKLIVRSDTGAHDTLVNRQMIELLAKPLVDKNLLFIGAIGDMDKQLNKWKEFGGK